MRVINREEVKRALGNAAVAEALLSSYERALDSVDPYWLVKKRVKVSGERLLIDGDAVDLGEVSEVYVVGAGKATYRMALAVEEVLGDRITEGLISVPRRQETEGLKRIVAIKAGHPVPDEGSLKAAEEILKMRPSGRCFVLALISGGGSALLELPEDEITLEDLALTNEALLRSGASIEEINCIRKAISRVKGGRLLAHFSGCRVIQLTVSDVPGNDLSSIASGPFFPGLCDAQAVSLILKRYGLYKGLPERVLRALSSYSPEGQSAAGRASYYILADNSTALESLKEGLTAQGYAVVGSISLSKEVEEVTRAASEAALALKGGQAVIGGGEAKVRVMGGGMGGRALHLAALLMRRLGDVKGIYGLSATTDGIDGNTEAAGCLFSPGIDDRPDLLDESIRGYNTYSEFLRLGTVIFTGYTGTNVNDLLAVVKV